jgi:hypothetical protein
MGLIMQKRDDLLIDVIGALQLLVDRQGSGLKRQKADDRAFALKRVQGVALDLGVTTLHSVGEAALGNQPLDFVDGLSPSRPLVVTHQNASTVSRLGSRCVNDARPAEHVPLLEPGRNPPEPAYREYLPELISPTAYPLLRCFEPAVVPTTAFTNLELSRRTSAGLRPT